MTRFLAAKRPSPSITRDDEPKDPPQALVVALALALLLAPLLPLATAETTTASIANTAPTVTSQSLPDTSLTPTAGSTTSATATIQIEDLNGCSDLVRVDAQINDSAGTKVLGSTNITPYDSCSAGIATYTYTFDMQYYFDPATDLSIDDDYRVYVEAEDKAGAVSNNALDLGLLDFTFAELAAVNLDKSTMDFGTSLSPGTTSSSVQLTVENYGNVQIDTDVSGSQLSHATESANIAVSSVEYNLTNDNNGATTLSATATSISGFDLAKGSGSSQALYWWLAVPSGSNQWVPSGDYTGTVTVSAVKG